MMRTVSLFALLVGVSSTDPQWEQYKRDFKKSYLNEADEQRRYGIFKESLARIDKLNKLNGEKVFDLTRNSDRLMEEKHHTGYKRSGLPRSTAEVLEVKSPRNPASIDWSKTKVVTPVKNQGQCGSCWAFSAAETIESQYILGTGVPVSLSPQQITSCTTTCDGCNGGEPYLGYDYLKTVPGLSSDFFWPYEESLTQEQATQSCSVHNITQIDGQDQELIGHFAAVSGYKWATPECSSGACDNQDLKKLAQATESTPVSICVNAGTFNDYVGGVLTDAACGSHAADSLDHCVQLVGFNTTAAKPYWIVRNSWDTEWGMNGYIHMQYDANTCGLANEATVPTASSGRFSHEHRERFFREATNVEPASVIV